MVVLESSNTGCFGRPASQSLEGVPSLNLNKRDQGKTFGLEAFFVNTFECRMCPAKTLGEGLH